MKCIIIGIETDNKWKNLPVSKQAISAAKSIMAEYSFLTMREALARVNRAKIKEIMKEKA